MTSSNSTSDMQPPFEPAGHLREWKAQHEVERGHSQVNGEGAEGGGGGELALAGQFDEADHGRERGVLDQLYEKTDSRRDGKARRLRHDDVAQLRGEAEAKRGAGLPLGPRDGLQAAAPDLAQEGGGIARVGSGCGDPG